MKDTGLRKAELERPDMQSWVQARINCAIGKKAEIEKLWLFEDLSRYTAEFGSWALEKATLVYLKKESKIAMNKSFMVGQCRQWMVVLMICLAHLMKKAREAAQRRFFSSNTTFVELGSASKSKPAALKWMK